MTNKSSVGLQKWAQPKYRIFISVDIVSSGELKARGSPSGNDGSELTYKSAKWVREFSNFFGSLSQSINQQWFEMRSDHGAGSEPLIGEPPIAWKTIGDEIVFVKKIEKGAEVFITVAGFCMALQKFQTRNPSLNVKATIFGAGFPITNAEFLMDVGSPNINGRYIFEPKLRSIHLSKTKREALGNSVIQDFLGPSIDSGFRLAEFSSPRYIPLSLDIVWFMNRHNVHYALIEKLNIKIPPIVYMGRKKLKGVWSGALYPVFCLDLKHDRALGSSESKLLGTKAWQPPQEEILDFCRAYYQSKGNPLHEPFIPEEYIEQGFAIPSDLFTSLLDYQDEIEEEFDCYDEAERNVSISRDDLSETDVWALGELLIKEFNAIRRRRRK